MLFLKNLRNAPSTKQFRLKKLKFPQNIPLPSTEMAIFQHCQGNIQHYLGNTLTLLWQYLALLLQDLSDTLVILKCFFDNNLELLWKYSKAAMLTLQRNFGITLALCYSCPTFTSVLYQFTSINVSHIRFIFRHFFIYFFASQILLFSLNRPLGRFSQ